MFSSLSRACSQLPIVYGLLVHHGFRYAATASHSSKAVNSFATSLMRGLSSSSNSIHSELPTTMKCKTGEEVEGQVSDRISNTAERQFDIAQMSRKVMVASSQKLPESCPLSQMGIAQISAQISRNVMVASSQKPSIF